MKQISCPSSANFKFYKTKKALLVAALIVGCNCIANAQNDSAYKRFKVAVGIGNATNAGDAGSGLLLFMEPCYTIKNKISIGLKLEQTFTSMRMTNSELLTADYYLNKDHRIHVFTGGGIGFYYVQDAGGCDPGPSISEIANSTKQIGGMIRTGFEYNHFRFSIEYNFEPETYTTYNNDQGNVTTPNTMSYNNNYWAIKFGICIGGGKKK